MPVPLLGLLICISHKYTEGTLDPHLEVEVVLQFMIALALNLECGVISLVGQVVLCSKEGHLECSIILLVITSKILASCSVVLK